MKSPSDSTLLNDSSHSSDSSTETDEGADVQSPPTTRRPDLALVPSFSRAAERREGEAGSTGDSSHSTGASGERRRRKKNGRGENTQYFHFKKIFRTHGVRLRGRCRRAGDTHYSRHLFRSYKLVILHNASVFSAGKGYQTHPPFVSRVAESDEDKGSAKDDNMFVAVPPLGRLRAQVSLVYRILDHC